MLYQEKHFQEFPIEPKERRSDCPYGLNDVILKCLEKNPVKRFPDFIALKKELVDLYYQLTGKRIQKNLEAKQSLDNRDMINKAISLIGLGKYEDGIVCLDNVLSTTKGNELNWIIFNSRGSAFAAVGEMEKALADYESAIRLFPNRPLSYNERANLYSNLGELQKALNDYNNAIALDDSFAIGYYSRGLCYRRLEEYEKALEDFNRAIESGHYESYTNRGSTYLNLGRNEEALSDFHKALELYPRNSIALMNIGGICENCGQDKEAFEYYTRAIEITPMYLLPYFKRAYLFVKEENNNAAIEDYEKALSIDPRRIPKDATVDYSLSKTELDDIYPLIYHDCGLTYLKIGNFLKGKEYLQRFLKIASPYHRDKIEPAICVLAWVNAQLGIC
jgi:tetratricopeptide (TPR) repeat protein